MVSGFNIALVYGMGCLDLGKGIGAYIEWRSGVVTLEGFGSYDLGLRGC